MQFASLGACGHATLAGRAPRQRRAARSLADISVRKAHQTFDGIWRKMEREKLLVSCDLQMVMRWWRPSQYAAGHCQHVIEIRRAFRATANRRFLANED
jgi:hypothetical protein